MVNIILFYFQVFFYQNLDHALFADVKKQDWCTFSAEPW